MKEINGSTSDGYHTFDELYYHRTVLFAVICNTYCDKAWKSWLHADGTMYVDYFIVGVTTPKGDYTYHYHKDYWEMFDVNELKKAPVWDGHLPCDVDRLLSLNGETKRASQLEADNQRLYGMLNMISDIIERGRVKRARDKV